MANILAISAFIVGILAFVFWPWGFGLLIGFIALVLAIISLVKIKNDPLLGGKAISIIALILALIPILYFSITFLGALFYFGGTDITVEQIPAGQEIEEETALHTCSADPAYMSCGYEDFKDGILTLSFYNWNGLGHIYESIEANIEGCTASESNPKILDDKQEEFFTFICEPKVNQDPIKKSIEWSFILYDGSESDTYFQNGFVII